MADRFPSPFEIETPTGAEGWQELYTYSLPFSTDRREYEDSMFWFMDGVHTPEVLEPWDATVLDSSPEGVVLDLSWYGDTEVHLSLGGAFHSGRLGIRASQVGTVSPARRGRRTHADRLALALELLRDPGFDAFITGVSPFDELPALMSKLAQGEIQALCHTVSYGEG